MLRKENLQLGQQCNKGKKEECGLERLGITSHTKIRWGMCHKIGVSEVDVTKW